MKGHAPHATSEGRPAGPHQAGHTAGASLLGLLLGATATALGALVSWWLVPPYLLGMVWLLLPTEQVAAWRSHLRARRAPGAGPMLRDDPRPAAATSAEVDPAPPAEGLATHPDVAVARPRRKRAPRKPRLAPVVAEPVAATWVQVGPGRFVRVEVSGGPPDPTDEPPPDTIPGRLDAEQVQPQVEEPAPEPNSAEPPVEAVIDDFTMEAVCDGAEDLEDLVGVYVTVADTLGPMSPLEFEDAREPEADLQDESWEDGQEPLGEIRDESDPESWDDGPDGEVEDEDAGVW